MEKFQEILAKVYELIVTYGMKFIMAIVVLVVGLIVIKWITKGPDSHDEEEQCESIPDSLPENPHQHIVEGHADHQRDGHGGHSDDLLYCRAGCSWSGRGPGPAGNPAKFRRRGS
jgi:hypothetical protein